MAIDRLPPAEGNEPAGSRLRLIPADIRALADRVPGRPRIVWYAGRLTGEANGYRRIKSIGAAEAPEEDAGGDKLR